MTYSFSETALFLPVLCCQLHLLLAVLATAVASKGNFLKLKTFAAVIIDCGVLQVYTVCSGVWVEIFRENIQHKCSV
jgi:hypothetical protein